MQQIPIKYNGYQFNVENDNGYFKMVPVNFKTQAIIIEKTQEETIISTKKYLKRVAHYNAYSNGCYCIN